MKTFTPPTRCNSNASHLIRQVQDRKETLPKIPLKAHSTSQLTSSLDDSKLAYNVKNNRPPLIRAQTALNSDGALFSRPLENLTEESDLFHSVMSVLPSLQSPQTSLLSCTQSPGQGARMAVTLQPGASLNQPPSTPGVTSSRQTFSMVPQATQPTFTRPRAFGGLSRTNAVRRKSYLNLNGLFIESQKARKEGRGS